MELGSKITIYGVEYTVWLIEGTIYHIKDAEENGICATLDWILKEME